VIRRPDPKAHSRSDLRMSENMFLKIRIHAILFVRPPMTRIRHGHALPEIPPAHAGPAAAGEPRRRTRERLSKIAEAARPSSAFGRTAHSRARAPEGSAWRARRSGPSVGLAAPAGRGIFPPCKSLKIKETELQSRQIILTRSASRCHGGDRLVEPKGVRGKSDPADEGRRSFPTCKPLKKLETAKESR
jgi:hypothetical protein